MAISRAQLLKELLPGLNALFGMEYQRYGEEHKDIFIRKKFRRRNKIIRLRSCTKTKATPSLMIMHKKLLQLDSL
jgi:hypothetical protein